MYYQFILNDFRNSTEIALPQIYLFIGFVSNYFLIEIFILCKVLLIFYVQFSASSVFLKLSYALELNNISLNNTPGFNHFLWVLFVSLFKRHSLVFLYMNKPKPKADFMRTKHFNPTWLGLTSLSACGIAGLQKVTYII